ACGFVVVGWPAAIEINPELPFRLGKDALEQIVPVSKRARKARDLAEDVRPLPSKIKGHNASEGRAHNGSVRRARKRPVLRVDQRFERFDKETTIVLIARQSVLRHPVVRMNSNSDHFFDGVHLIEYGEDFICSPCISGKRFFLEEEIVTVVHVEHRIFFEGVLVVTRRQEYTEAMLTAGSAHERCHQFADAAMRVLAKIWMNLDRRAGSRDCQKIFSTRPLRGIV